MKFQESIIRFVETWFSEASSVTVHTSGSTGVPKVIRAEKSRMRASAALTCRFLGLEPGQSALLCLSTDYIAGMMMIVRAVVQHLRLYCVTPSSHPLAQGVSCWLLDFSGKDAVVRQPVRVDGLPSQLHFAAMVPMQVHDTMLVPEEAERLRSVRHLIIGGGAVDAALEQQLRLFPYAVWSTYGMTETLSHIALRRLSGVDASCGYRPLEGVRVWTDGCGRLVVEALSVCRDVLVTNDRATVAEDGTFCILGRVDNVIDTGGIKVQIEQIEALLQEKMAQPFMITKVADRRLGEAVTMLTTDARLDVVRQMCRDVLPKYYVPKHYLVVDKLPYTSNGKPARAMAEQLAQDLLR